MTPIDWRHFLPAELVTLVGGRCKANTKLGWEPQVAAQDLGTKMVAFDLLAGFAWRTWCISHINVVCRTNVSILELTQMVAQVTGFQGRIATDPSKPDRTPHKLMDVSRLAQMGWRTSLYLDDGLGKIYRLSVTHSDIFRR